MELRPELFAPESAERFEAELLETAQMAMDTDELLALSNLFTLVGGYAAHLETGMTAAGFKSEEATTLGWRTAWNKLRAILDEQTPFTAELATAMERSLPFLHSGTKVTDVGEPTDPTTRTFYQTFITRLDHPAVHPTAAWLFE